MTKAKSVSLDKLFYQYTHLPIGGKEIVCPYWMNKIKEGILGPYGGKGTPLQIVQATNDEAQKAGFNLQTTSDQEILAFMRQKKIGVDCSGFVFWMLDALDKEKGGNGIADDIPSSKGRFIQARTNAAMLTGEEISVKIDDLSKIKVGDMVRLNGGKHVAIIVRIEKSKIVYAHSSAKTKDDGVHLAQIMIKNKGGLESQEWGERDYRGGSYKDNYYCPEKGDSVRRLKIWV